MRKTVTLWGLGWVLLISALHAALNLDLLRKAERGEAQFRVGFLPVT